MSTYSYDWTTPVLPNFLRIKSLLKRVDNILEIGSFEGRSTCWFLEHLLTDTGTVNCIDPFLYLDKDCFSRNKVLETEQSRKSLFLDTTNRTKKQFQTVNLIQEKSYIALSQLIQENVSFDFIYIDGNHTTESVITDAVMSFGLLNKGGIMLFDDYLLEPSENWFYQNSPIDERNSVKSAVDSFLNLFRTRVIKIPLKNAYQLAVFKK